MESFFIMGTLTSPLLPNKKNIREQSNHSRMFSVIYLGLRISRLQIKQKAV